MLHLSYVRENDDWKMMGFISGMNVPEMDNESKIVKVAKEMKQDVIFCQIIFGDKPIISREVEVDEVYEWILRNVK